MRWTRFLLIATATVAILVAVSWLLRDALIQKISNPLLEEYGIAVVDVSLDSLTTGNASIGYLELAHEKGTSVVIDELSITAASSPSDLTTYTAEKVTILTTTRDDDAAFEMALLIDQFLSLPQHLETTELAVNEFSMPPYPVIRDLRLRMTGGVISLSAKIEAVAMAATVSRIDEQNHRLVFTLPDAPPTAAQQSIGAGLQQSESGISLLGEAAIELPAWQPLTRLAGIVPREIDIKSGTAELTFAVDIPYDTSQSPAVTATLQPSPLQLVYSGAADAPTFVAVGAGSVVEVAASFPEIAWTVRQAETSLSVTDGDWHDIPVSISNLSCETGPACSLQSRIVMHDTQLPIGTVERMELVAADEVTFTDAGVQVEFAANARLEIDGLSTGDFDAERITASLPAAATLQFMDSGWQLEAAALDTTVASFTVSNDMSFTADVFVENISVADKGDVFAANLAVFAPSSEMSLADKIISLPGFKGAVTRDNADVSLDLRTVGLDDSGSINGRYDLDSGAGQLGIADFAVSFGAQALSDRISPWLPSWDISNGTVLLGVRLNWAQADAKLNVDGHGAVRAQNLAGHYDDSAFVNLSTAFEASFSSATGFTATPSTISVGVVDMGLPIENISGSYLLRIDERAIDVEQLQMTTLGGTVRTEPFSFYTDRTRNTLVLHAESIALDALMTLKEFDAIEVSGRIAAELPVIFDGDTITIADGSLVGEPPGGVIRYLPDDPPDLSDTSSIALVTRALSNFEYDSLTSEVNYSEDGNLNVQLHLTGRNPDLDGQRPVVFNLGVENNVPQMLKSLRAARAVEEILEKRLAQ